MVKSTAEKIADRLKDENFLDKFMLVMRLLDNGVIGKKRVAKISGGNIGGVYVPKDYIGQMVRFIMVPENPELKNMEEALINNEKERLKLKRKYLKLKQWKRDVIDGKGPIETPEEVKEILEEKEEPEEKPKAIPLINNPNSEPDEESDEEY